VRPPRSTLVPYTTLFRSLRERVQDIAPLARGMAARFNTRFKKDLFDISPNAMDVLESYTWPGNIRQLENCVQQAVLVSSGHELRSEEHTSELQSLAYLVC